MFKGLFLVMAWTLVATSAQAQDPQALMNALIQRQMQQDEVRQQNSMRRLELERLDLEQQLRFRRATDSQIGAELSRYCPKRRTAVFAVATQRSPPGSRATGTNPVQSRCATATKVGMPDDG
jgi:hypothetical protein